MDSNSQPNTLDYEGIIWELNASIVQLSDRCLHDAASWSSELLNNLMQEHALQIAEKDYSLHPSLIERNEEKLLCMKAKSLINTKEFKMCHNHLKQANSSKGIFLRNYSLYLAGNERKIQEQVASLQPVQNQELQAISDDLNASYKNGKLDSFCSYLYGIVLKETSSLLVVEELHEDEGKHQTLPNSAPSKIVSQVFPETQWGFSTPRHLQPKHPQQSSKKINPLSNQTQKEHQDHEQKAKHSQAFQRALFVNSIRHYPWNWSAWTALTTTIKDIVTLNRLDAILPSHWIKPFWYAHSLLEIRQNEMALEYYLKLNQQFPKNRYIRTQMAIVYHNLRNLDPSEDLFAQVHREDPYQLYGMDHYSNILYIKEDRTKLAHLAHHTISVEKYSPESCCVVGNYYSLIGERTKAILSYLRALKLSPDNLDAWTLIGHEYLELKEANNAIAAYRRAVDANSSAYRAWFGLGQAYELLCMPQYALYYFERACELRPFDSRMWCALGNCFENTGHLADALLCYHRAESNEDKDGIVLNKLAELYNKIGKKDEAAAYYKLLLETCEREPSNMQDLINALHFLAYYYKEINNFAQAYNYCSRLVDYKGPEMEEAKALMREMSALQASSNSTSSHSKHNLSDLLTTS